MSKMRVFHKKFMVFFVIIGLTFHVIYGYTRAVILLLIPIHYRHRKDIRGKTVLITGAGNGVGQLLAIEFSKHSTALVLLDLNKNYLQNTVNKLDPRCKSFIYECDVSKRENVYKVAKHIKDDIGKVDILVNNAGVISGQRFLDIPDEKIEKTIEVNILAHFWMCKAFLPDMMKSNSGHIVSMSSLAGMAGFPRMTDYCASKFGVNGFIEALTMELSKQRLNGIKFTTVCPTLISTGLFDGMKPPLNVILDPVNVAKEVIDAVLTEREWVIMPRWKYIIILLKCTMPQIAVKAFYKHSGLLHLMDGFEGRQNIANNNIVKLS